MIIEMAGGAMTYAGRAAAEVSTGQRQFRRDLIDVHRINTSASIRKAALHADTAHRLRRDALATEKLQAQREKEREAEMRKVGQEWSAGLRLASEIGVEVSPESALELDAEILRSNPAIHATITGMYPLPESVEDPHWPVAMGKRIEAVRHLRTTAEAIGKDRLYRDFLERTDGLELDAESLLDVEQVREEGTARELKLAIDGAKRAASRRALYRAERDHLQEEARKLLPLIVKQRGYAKNESLQRVLGHAVYGTSENPRQDLFRLQAAADGNADMLEAVQADAIEFGRAMGMKERPLAPSKAPRPSLPPALEPPGGGDRAAQHPAVDAQETSSAKPDVSFGQMPGLEKALGLKPDSPFRHALARDLREAGIALSDKDAVASFIKSKVADGPSFDATYARQFLPGWLVENMIQNVVGEG